MQRRCSGGEMNGEAYIEAFHGGQSVLIARSSHSTNCLDCLSDVMPDLMKRWPCFSARAEWRNSRMKVASSLMGTRFPGWKLRFLRSNRLNIIRKFYFHGMILFFSSFFLSQYLSHRFHQDENYYSTIYKLK